MPKDSMKKARTFNIGDKVLVYNTQTKVNSIGVVKDCQSNNSYIVVVDGREKHISSDHMSLLQKDNSDNDMEDDEKISDKVLDDEEDPKKEAEIIYDSDDDEDLVHSSLPCDDSDDDEDLVHSSLPSVNRNIGYVPVPQRKYKTESQKLYDSLSVAPPASRLRSGK